MPLSFVPVFASTIPSRYLGTDVPTTSDPRILGMLGSLQHGESSGDLGTLHGVCAQDSCVSGFMWMSLIHLDLSFVPGDKYGSIFIFLYNHCHLDQHHLLKVLSFFHCVLFWLLCQRSNDHKCVTLFWDLQFYSIGQPVSEPTPCSLYHWCSIVKIKFRYADFPGNAFIFKNCFCISGSLLFHTKLRTSLYMSVKNCVEIFMNL